MKQPIWLLLLLALLLPTAIAEQPITNDKTNAQNQSPNINASTDLIPLKCTRCQCGVEFGNVVIAS